MIPLTLTFPLNISASGQVLLSTTLWKKSRHGFLQTATHSHFFLYKVHRTQQIHFNQMFSFNLKSTNVMLLPLTFSSNFVPHLIMLIKGKTWLIRRCEKNLDLPKNHLSSKKIGTTMKTLEKLYQRVNKTAPDTKPDFDIRRKMPTAYKASNL